MKQSKVLERKPVFLERDLRKLILLLAATFLLSAAAGPCLDMMMNKTKMNLAVCAAMFGKAIVSYVAACVVIYLICRLFRSKIHLVEDCLLRWGYSFLPNLVVILLIAVTEQFSHHFIGFAFLGILASFLLATCLFWKMILLSMFLTDAAKLKGSRNVAAFLLIGAVYLVLACLQAKWGLKVPVL